MSIIAINGSPRKNKNTATILNKVLEGAGSKGVKTEIFNLYDLDFKGCISCFACKLKEGKSYGKCVLKDDLTPILEKIQSADALVLGSPIYLASVTGEMRSFMERLMFPFVTYTPGYNSIFGRKINTAFIYTMNVTNSQMQQMGYNQIFDFQEAYMKRIFGYCESLIINDTYQFDDYSKYVVTVFDEKKKAKVRDEEFPKECEKAFNLGVKLSKKI